MYAHHIFLCVARAAALTLLSAYAVPTFAQATAGLPPPLIIQDWLKPPFKVGTVGHGEAPVRELRPVQPEVAEARADVVAEARRLADGYAVIGLLLIEKDGSILFESYKKGANQQSVMIGYSMSKSATSVAVGQALCDGVLSSIEDSSGKYSEDLRGTAYGDSSIRNLLNLASGGKVGEQAGQPVPGFTTDLLRNQTRAIRPGFREYGSGSSAATRGELSYKNYDTYALGVALADATKQPAYSYFSKAVWSRIGAQSDAAWLLDRNGDTATAEGFGATLRDWARFALYIRDQLAPGNTSCLANYLREATIRKVPNKTTILSEFRAYGYGFWTENFHIRAPSLWMAGYGGQRIGVDPVSGRVLVLIGHVENFMPEVYRLFNLWTKN